MNNIKEDKYTFWTEDPTILYRDGKFLDFFPKARMTRIEQLNSIIRFCIYYMILLTITGNNKSGWIQLPLTIIGVVTLLYYIMMSSSDSILREIKNDKSRETTEHMSNLGGSTVSIYNDPINNDGNVIEAGYYDSNGKIYLGRFMNQEKPKENEINYTYDEIKKYKKATCKIPTINNPFMNPTYNEFNLESPPEACNADDEDIHQNIASCFKEDLFRDVSDLFDNKNSQRQFYTLSVPANPPDQTAFGRWLAKGTPSCKDGQAYCLGYEDIRFNR
jgi:hypothetical protein